MARSKDRGGPPDKPGEGPGDAPDNGDAAYEVGYGKPPVSARWPKGHSGNPAGRPRTKAKVALLTKMNPARDMFLEEFARPQQVKEGGVAVEMEAGRAVIRSAINSAIQGDRFKQRLVLQYATAAEASLRTDRENLVLNVEGYKLRWTREFDLARRVHGPEPTQLPHPDHVNIDPYSGELVISGPQTREEKKAWDHMKFELQESTKLLCQCQAKAAANPSHVNLKFAT